MTPASSLLELFQGPLRDVTFPDAGATELAHAEAETRAAADAVARAEVALDAARQLLAGSQHALARQIERTLAYARIFAADDPALLATLDGITVPGRRGPGRPRKDGSTPGATPRPRRAPRTPAREGAPDPSADRAAAE